MKVLPWKTDRLLGDPLNVATEHYRNSAHPNIGDLHFASVFGC